MNAHADLFDADLRDRTTWHVAIEPYTGQRLDDVIESFCGRYVILKTRNSLGAPIFMAWRRNTRDGRRETPSLLGGWIDGDAARAACAQHAEENT